MVKYFKLPIKQLQNFDYAKINEVAEEITNLIFSKQHFINGQVEKNAKPILYQTDIFDYEFHSNVMNILVFINSEIESSFNAAIFGAIKAKIDMLQKFDIKLPFCLPVCSHYTSIELLGVNLAMTTSKNPIPPGPFEFAINFVDSSAYIKSIISNHFPCVQDPLWTCIIDCNDVFAIEDRKMMVEFPKFKDLNIVANGKVHPTKIQLNGKRHILVEEFAKIFGFEKRLSNDQPTIFDPNLDVTNYTDSSTNMFDHDIYYELHNLDFNDPDFQPVNRRPDTTNPIIDIINGALLEDSKAKTDDGFEYEENKKDLHCYITGLPLYDKAYVFTIYEQKFFKRIKKEELKNYPDAQEINEIYCPHIESALEMQIYVDERTTVTPLFEFRTYDELQRDINFMQNEVKKKKGKETQLDIRKMINAKRKKIPKAGDMIEIEYVVKYKTPVSILVSPYFVHSRGGDNNPLNLFAQSTYCSFILWQVNIPQKFEDIIDTLSITPEKKEIFREIHEVSKKKNQFTGIEETEQFKFFTNETLFYKSMVNLIFDSSPQQKKIALTEFTVL